MSKKSWYLIQYDISDIKRLRRVHRLLKYSAFFLQESVYAWQGNTHELKILQQKLRQIIRPKEDDVRGYKVNDAIILFGAATFTQGTYFLGYPPHQQHTADTLKSIEPQ